MTRGVGPLLAAVTLLWGVIIVVSQVLAEPPLSPVVTIIAGVLLTNVLILGYGSTLRGPRQRRQRPRADRQLRSAEAGDPPLPQGLTNDVADQAVALLLPLLGGDAVSITDSERMLAFAGPGRDHHERGSPLHIPTRDRVLRTGRTLTVSGRGDDVIGCPEPGCPLRSAAVAPLRVGQEVIGTVTVYRGTDDPPRVELVEAAAGILSLHLELADLESQQRFAVDAELDALRAQINPHFLFNTLNTIASRIRTDPEDARQLLVRLSEFFRHALGQRGQFAGFSQEYAFVRTYVTLEQARFGDRLTVEYDIDPSVLGVEVPVLVVQPLVENAIKHGASGNVGRTTVRLRARVDPLSRTVEVEVRDDGVGMDAATREAVLNGHPLTAGGTGLSNIRARLQLLFADRHSFEVRSAPGEGTRIHLEIPL
jgi:LytS/YehU family sensor histidine kinase